MFMALKKNTFIKISILAFIYITFLIGFFLRDYVPGGAIGDFNEITWPLLQSFKKDFFLTIKNYGSFGEGSYPLFYIINSYLNPFTYDKTSFLISISVLSFLTTILLAIVLIKNISNISIIDGFLASSIILLLPFYRSSSYWGTTENLGWFFLILSFLFFLKIKSNLSKNSEVKIFTIVAFCFFSACSLYIRPALVFWPISYFVYLFLIHRNKKVILSSIISFLIFSLPGIILIFIWGDIYDSQNMDMKLTEDYHHYKYIVKNIPILLSYFSFYFLPFLIIELVDIGLKKFSFKYLKVFLIALLILIIFWKFNFLNYLGNFTYGGGAILKLNYLIKPGNYFLLLISSSVGFSIIYQILKEDFKTNVSILLPIFIFYGLPNMLFQEYVEPLFLLIIYSGILQTQLNQIYFKRIFTSNLITILYFILYLVSATYYDHFI